MSSSVETRRWTPRRWWAVVALIFAAQLGLIFALSDKQIVQPRQPGVVPDLHLAGAAADECLALGDPTLFALPHRCGFAGLAWLAVPPPPTNSFDWPEEPHCLQLQVQQLGASLAAPTGTDDLNLIATHPAAAPALTLAGAAAPARPVRSRLRIEDELAARRLVTPLEVPDEPSTDLLADSVVQIVVDAEGRLASVPVLLSSSGSPDADNQALRLARIVRFNRIPSGGPTAPAGTTPRLAWGRLIFQWHTVPVPATNTPPTIP